MPDPVIQTGTCFAVHAFEVGQAIDLDRAERRIEGPERLRVKERRRAPSYFEYRPAPLRVAVRCEPTAVGAATTQPSADIVLHDFGAVSVVLALPLTGPLSALPHLASEVHGNAALDATARRVVEGVVATLGDAVARPNIADFVEDYAIYVVEAFTAPLPADALVTEHARVLAQVLRADPRDLSVQEIAEAVSHRISFGLDDVTVVDGDGAFVFDREPDDVRDVLEFANVQLLEMRFLDRQLDSALDRTYEELARVRVAGFKGPDLRRLARYQLDAAVLFEQVSNALKLIGDQFLARVYRMAARRLHLSEWDGTVTRKLETIEGIYSKLTDQASARRLELLEWIIIVLIAVSIALPLFG